MLFHLPLAAGALASAATVAQWVPRESAAAASLALPSGSSGEFRQRMLDWTAPDGAKLLIAKDAGQPIKAARLDRLKISSPFGWRIDPIDGTGRRHEGIDLPGPAGSPVMATGAGVVEIAGWVRGYGNLVQIEHSGGVRTRYGHLSRLHVQRSQYVEQGQLIGNMGSTGHSTGPHLHYEVRVNGVSIDPLRFVARPTERPETVWGIELPAVPRWTGWSEQQTQSALPTPQIH